ncbi:hypothetical protein RHMOL_Rhmol06G0057900 [Rhododendron molle]|uniref:Uncharacterized protein n=1 Tax=Rhododendron molle TaxID=49168 RepID=A0ACC0NAN2_RHOML|nr:hypothetical protein RHMOL_Rhmol06G0057900 [Rhododendron molle]
MSLSYWPSPSSSSSAAFRCLPMEKPTNPFLSPHFVPIRFKPTLQIRNFTLESKNRRPTISCCSNNNSAVAETGTTSYERPPGAKRGRRYSKQYPGQKEGITEEMRFVAMKLRNVKGKKVEADSSGEEEGEEDDGNGGGSSGSVDEDGDGGGGVGQTWKPTMKGFVKYLVDSKHVFDFVERIVDESDDVSYTHFRRTGLERSKGLSKDLEWFSQQDTVIPPPSNPGVAYVKYLEGLVEKSPPLFLSHFYNIYFSHIAGGQVIAKQVSEKLLQGRELEFYKWEGNAEELFKGVREKLNMLGKHWGRDEKNRCLCETRKSLHHMGQIVRLIIL